MNFDKFLNALNAKCLELDEKYCINSGYCFYIAYLIAKFLESKNIKYKFVEYLEPWGDSYIVYHYAVLVENHVINPANEFYSHSDKTKYIEKDSKWMYKVYKESYDPKFSYYWKDYHRYAVNKELKTLFKGYDL